MAGPEALSSRDSEILQKSPPNSIEAEEALLGSALLSRDASNRLMEAVKPSDFYSPTNQTIFEAMILEDQLIVLQFLRQYLKIRKIQQA